MFQRIINKLLKLGYYNQLAALIIDKIYREQSTHFLGRSIHFFLARLAYLTLFIPLTLIDTLMSGLIATTYSVRTFFTSDEAQDDFLAQQKKYSMVFSKSLFALAASIIGLVSPKLVVLYFIPRKEEQKGVHAGGDYHHAQNAVIEEPESVEELQQIIKKAAIEGKKVIPKGAGFSQGKQFIPEGDEELIVIDLKKLNTVEIHSKEKEAIVGAGAIWSDIKLEANKFKLALKVMQASDVFSVGGSLGTNIHGWNIHDGMLSTVVSSITIINAQGELQTLTSKDPLFHHVIGGVGLYGIVVEATIRLTDNELLKEKGVEVAPEQYASYFRDEVQTDEKTHMHLYRLSLNPQNLLGSGVAVSYVKEEDKPPVKDLLSVEGKQGTRFERVFINLARHSTFIRKKYWEMERNRLLANDMPAMSVNRIMQPPIKAMFNSSVSESEWLQEFFLPETHLAEFLKQLGSLLSENEVGLLNASVRFVKQNKESPLSYAHDGDRFAVVLCFNQSLDELAIIKARKWMRKAQHLAIEQGGTYYLPYQHVSDPEDFKHAYPYIDEAIRMKEEVDPDHLFVNGFYQKYIAPQPDVPNYFKIMMASEESKAKCSGFLKNVLYRLDSDKFFPLLEDILKYNDTHEEIYKELVTRLPEIASNALSDFRNILSSLTSIKSDLSEQAYSLLPQDKKTINGLVEIGYPGRFVKGFKQHYKITGEIVAVYEQPSVTDYIQTGIPRPYDRFEPLDYTNPNLKHLSDNSADVITCYVGLHHFKDEKLDEFLKDVRRVLRPNGRFLLVDHDVRNQEDLAMAHMAHSIFNAVTGVSLEAEMKETRQFHSMEHWKNLLEKYGFGYGVSGPDVPMIRPGDPTRNRMVSFVKPGPLMQLNPKKGEDTIAIIEKKESMASRELAQSSTVKSATSFPGMQQGRLFKTAPVSFEESAQPLVEKEQVPHSLP